MTCWEFTQSFFVSFVQLRPNMLDRILSLSKSSQSSQSSTISSEFSTHSYLAPFAPICSTDSRCVDHDHDHRTSVDALYNVVCSHSPKNTKIIIRHLIAESICDEHIKTEVTSKENAKLLDDNSISLAFNFAITSHDSVISTGPKFPWNVSSKSHEDFEAPQFLIEGLKHKGFSLGQSIGSGTYGKVYLATFNESTVQNKKHWQVEQSYAVKVMDKQRLSVQYKSKFLGRELRALLSLEAHENIVRFYDMFTVSGSVAGQQQGRLIAMIMEYCPNGDMFEFIHKRPQIPEPLARRWFVQLLAAVGHLHERALAHRDLKAENLLLDAAYNLKIADFGFSLDLTNKCDHCQQANNEASISFEKRSLTFCGSQSYCSPELLQAEAYCATLNDVWSCGVILYVWLFNMYPIDGKMLEKMDQFEFAMIDYPRKPHITAQCRVVMQCIFQPEEMRSSVAQLQELLWVEQYDGQGLEEIMQQEKWAHLDLPRQETRSFEPHYSSSLE